MGSYWTCPLALTMTALLLVSGGCASSVKDGRKGLEAVAARKLLCDPEAKKECCEEFHKKTCKCDVLKPNWKIVKGKCKFKCPECCANCSKKNFACTKYKDGWSFEGGRCRPEIKAQAPREQIRAAAGKNSSVSSQDFEGECGTCCVDCWNGFCKKYKEGWSLRDGVCAQKGGQVKVSAGPGRDTPGARAKAKPATGKDPSDPTFYCPPQLQCCLECDPTGNCKRATDGWRVEGGASLEESRCLRDSPAGGSFNPGGETSQQEAAAEAGKRTKRPKPGTFTSGAAGTSDVGPTGAAGGAAGRTGTVATAGTGTGTGAGYGYVTGSTAATGAAGAGATAAGVGFSAGTAVARSSAGSRGAGAAGGNPSDPTFYCPKQLHCCIECDTTGNCKRATDGWRVEGGASLEEAQCLSTEASASQPFGGGQTRTRPAARSQPAQGGYAAQGRGWYGPQYPDQGQYVDQGPYSAYGGGYSSQGGFQGVENVQGPFGNYPDGGPFQPNRGFQTTQGDPIFDGQRQPAFGQTQPTFG